MLVLMADVNAEGYVRALASVLQGSHWLELWIALGIRVITLDEQGLARTTSDDVLWEACQRDGIILITANRNDDSPDSLEATLRARNAVASLPVITLADPGRILIDRPYAERAARRLIEILFDLDDFRGAGRLYIP